ncbi:AMP-binding protein [Streptomyces sp. NPDC051018]|uniref:AMP-binding protein n=1 Tax=Streptomyces sp. NPDC051018 TaxID=3365639 RepID=UPI0037A2B126
MPVSFPARLARLAADDPGATALVLVRADGREESLTWGAFDRRVQALAGLLVRSGVSPGSTVVIGYPNSLEHFVAVWACWAAGALALPLNPRMPEHERDALLSLADPAVILADWGGRRTLDRTALPAAATAAGRARLPDTVSHPGKAIASGGSTGTPKIIVDPRPWSADPERAVGELGERLGFQDARSSLVPGPLYHNMAFSWGNLALFAGQRTVVMEKFDAALLLDLVPRHAIEFMTLVPTMMQRCARLPDADRRDLSSLRGIVHSGAVCPRWVKETWLQLVDPRIVFEAFGSTEGLGGALIRGDEWIEHPGSVGRPDPGALRILDERRRPVAPGETGEIFVKAGGTPSYRYVGAAPAEETSDGWIGLGDLGRLDEDGYLHISDRRVDLIISGGVNVYPAEVEAVLGEHPSVEDAVVIGLPDEEWGRRVHAVVQLAPDAVASADGLGHWCRERLSPHKVPKSFGFTRELPRDAAGKIRRGALARQTRTAADEGSRA